MPSKKQSSQKKATAQLAPAIKQITTYSEELDLAQSRLEQTFWQKKLQALIVAQFEAGQSLDALQKRLEKTSPGAGDALFAEVLTISESATMNRDGQLSDCLLVALPLLVSTRYVVPQVTLTDADTEEIAAAILDCVLASQASIRLLPGVFSLMQTPESYLDTWRCLQHLCNGSVDLRKVMPRRQIGDTDSDLQADSRYVIFCVSTPQGQPLFAWQEDTTKSRTNCLQALQQQLAPTWRRLMPGCDTQTLLPQLYRAALAQGEELIVPVIVQTTCRWLTESLQLSKGALKASVCAVGQGTPTEYRIGYYRSSNPDVVAGNIWPIIDSEPVEEDQESNPILTTLYKTLNDLGITDIKSFLQPVELPQYCNDCGAPFFPDATGELVHPYLPEQAQESPKQLH